MRRNLFRLVFAFAIGLPTLCLADSWSMSWGRADGGWDDRYHAVAYDGVDGVFATGVSRNRLPDGTLLSGYGMLLSRYSTSGDLLWSQNSGLFMDYQEGTSIATDGNGGVYVVGSEFRPFLSETTSFLQRYDVDGNLNWARQVGEDNFEVKGVSMDPAGNILVAGGNGNPRLAKYNASGDVLWDVEMKGRPWNRVESLATDSQGNAFITGTMTPGFFITEDPPTGAGGAYVAKYNGNGEFVWAQHLPAALASLSTAATTDADGNVFIAGLAYQNSSPPHQTYYDAFVAKYNANGTPGWTHRLATEVSESFNSIDVDELGNVVAIGGSNRVNSLILKFTASGELLADTSLKMEYPAYMYGVAAGSSGEIYLAGTAIGLPTGELGPPGAFIGRFSIAVPEPASDAIVVSAFAATLLGPRWRKEKAMRAGLIA